MKKRKVNKFIFYSLSFLFYFLCSLVILFFAQKCFSSFFQGHWIYEFSILIIMLFLLIVFFVLLVGVYASLFFNKNQYRLQQKHTIIVTYIVLLGVLPQVVLAFLLIHTSVNTWINSSMGKALGDGYQLALEYSQSLKKNIAWEWASVNIQTQSKEKTLYRPAAWGIYDTNGYLREAHGHLAFLDPKINRPFVEHFAYGDRINQFYIAFYTFANNIPLPFQDRKSNFKQHIQGVPIVYFFSLPKNLETQMRQLESAYFFREQLNHYQKEFYISIFILYLVLILPLILLCLFFGFIWSNPLAKSLKKLEKSILQLGQGDFSIHVEYSEYPSLFQALNITAQKLDLAQLTLQYRQNLENWSQFTSQLAHEIKNPLTSMSFSIELLDQLVQQSQQEESSENNEKKIQDEKKDQMGIYLAMLYKSVNQINSVLKEFKSRKQEALLEEKPILIEKTLKNSIEFFQKTHKNVQFHYSNKNQLSRLWIVGDFRKLQQVFYNLFQNSYQAKKTQQSKIIIQVILEKNNEDNIQISIIDNGVGMDEYSLKHIFEPYFSNKTEGSGLGMSVVESIIDQHKGQISVHSQIDKGTHINIVLPTYIRS